MNTKVKRQKIRFFFLTLSFLLFPITIFYLSPVLSLKAAGEGVLNGSLIIFGIMFLIALFLGRGFCGWACPGGGLAELLIPVWKKKVSLRTAWIKWLFWIPWFGMILWFLINSVYQGADFLYDMESPVSVANTMGWVVLLGISFLIFVLSVSAGKRSFCHHACWMAPFMIIGRKISLLMHLPALHLKTNASACTSCTLCTRNCPMSIDIAKKVQINKPESSHCILCGQCVDSCPTQAIQFHFGLRND